MFIGRFFELQELSETIRTNNSNIVPIIGRRGVGKTFLLNKMRSEIVNNKDVYNDCIVFNFEGVKGQSAKKQIVSFVKQINFQMKFHFNENNFLSDNISNWNDLFEQIYYKFLSFFKNKNKKIIFFIDELAWLHTKQSYFLEEFGGFWNKVKSDLPFYCPDLFFKVISTSSAISWMNNNFIKNKGSLYHKIDKVIFLKNFSLKETVYFLKVKKNLQCGNILYFQYYLITGGVARYLDKINPNLSFEENAVNIFSSDLTFNGFEIDDLFDRTFQSTKNIHKNIILLFKNKKRLTQKEIAHELKLNSGSVSEALKDLIVSDLIIERNNLKYDKNETYYYLSDLFCLAHVKIVHGNILNTELFNNQTYHVKSGELFEIACYLNIDLIKNAMGRSSLPSFEQAYYDHDTKTQIDLIVHYLNSNIFTLVECKFYNKNFEIDDALQYSIFDRKKAVSKIISKSKKINKKQEIVIDFAVVTFFDNFVKNPVNGFRCKNISIDKIMDTLI